MSKLPDTITLIDRGLLKRCPSCGEGRLFARYLKPVEACGECGEELGHIRADDGPAWLTMLVVAHIVVPIAAFSGHAEERWPLWLAMALGLVLLLLPCAKAIFIGIIWRTGCTGSGKKK